MSVMAFSPILVMDLDVARSLPAIEARRDAKGVPYASARCLVRADGDPIGVVTIDLTSGDLTPRDVARVLRESLGENLRTRATRHRSADASGAINGGAVPSTDVARNGGGTDAVPSTARRAPMLDATVVVATRDRPQSLERCLRSILAMEALPAAVVVVDNAPRDEAARMVVSTLATRAAVPICYVREERAGLAVAHNAALPHVFTTVVAFTDDDVVVDRQWLGRTVDAFGAAERVACVTGMIVPAELETREQLWMEDYAGFNKGFDRKVFDLGVNRPDDPLFPFTAGTLGSGANMAFTMACLRELGGFDVALGAGSGGFGGDDLAAFHDAIASGGQLVYEPAAIVRHYHHRDYDAVRRQVYGYGAGLTAYLTHCLLASPCSILAMMRHALRGLRRVVDPASAKNVNRPADFPATLTRAERHGMLLGPFAYLRTRWARRAPAWVTPAAPGSGV